jgi:hypothetical protein
LSVDFVDERFEAMPGDEVTFGRAATVVIDDGNEYMSRIVGGFVFHQGTWWLQNRSSSAQLSVIADTGQQKVLPPKTSDPVTAACGHVRFRSGRFNYELRFELTDPPAGPGQPADSDPVQPAPGAPTPKATEEFGVVPLNDEQRAMLALFSMSWLVDPAADHHEIPPNAEVAHQLGWSLKKLDRKLDYLCARLSDAGVQGLRGEKGGEATDRRRYLVEHVLSARLISDADIPEV